MSDRHNVCWFAVVVGDAAREELEEVTAVSRVCYSVEKNVFGCNSLLQSVVHQH